MKNPEYTLAISVSHNSSAALMRDGEILVTVCEERSRRVKNYIGYPKNAIDYCLKKVGIKGNQLNRIAYTTVDNSGILVKAKTNTQFTLQDYRDYYGEKFYKPKLRGEDCLDYLRWLRDDSKFNSSIEHFDFSYLTDEVLRDQNLDIKLFRDEQANVLSEHLGVNKEKIEFLDHHTCHAYYSYFGSPFREKDCIVLTLDGWGDGRNQTVWKVSGEKFTLLAESKENDLGRIYKMATLLLGMRPDEHEFKVMGLAAYAKSSHLNRAKQVIQDICKVEGMRIVSKNRPVDLFSYLEEACKTFRFDNLAGAVQAYTEEITCELVRNIIKETGIRRFVIGGGIAMNIKMNKAISELDEVEEIFVCGSSGDESLSIGGCYLMNSDPNCTKPLLNLYLGYDIKDEINDFDANVYAKKFDIQIDVTFDKVGALLARGDIVGVIRGRAEFGARALGNRSILANPSRRETVQKINEAIKNRDFWMPFALSILEERMDEYILNPKQLQSPFMAISLDVRPKKISEIEAGTHPYDKTVRPQAVSKINTPEYYSLISAFERATGIPALLNTSFNLHGEPIVDTITDAIRTFEISGLDHLLIDDSILFSKRIEDMANIRSEYDLKKS
jgi:carbamoyltransferase